MPLQAPQLLVAGDKLKEINIFFKIYIYFFIIIWYNKMINAVRRLKNVKIIF